MIVNRALMLTTSIPGSCHRASYLANEADVERFCEGAVHDSDSKVLSFAC